ncbi:MAG: hypothetical protein ACKOOG_12315 [Actinomycetota bacterium]
MTGSATAERLRHDLVAAAMLTRLARDPELSVVKHRLQVTSFGGSGTTALIEHLILCGADLPRTPGSFPFKHQSRPPDPETVPVGFRVLFPISDPRDAVVSIFRRNFQGGHYRGMRLRAPGPEAEARLASLDAFLAGGRDEFGFGDQFRAWHDGAPGYPVAFVRTSALGDVWDEVRRFAGLGATVPPFVWRPRASSWRELPAAERSRVDAIYGPLAAELDALPAFAVG